MDNKYIIALEIGSSAVQLAAVSFPDNNPSHITVVSAEEEPLHNCVRYGRIQNVDEVAAQTLSALDRLRLSPDLLDKTIAGVYTAVGGRSLHSIKATAQLSFPEETCINADIVFRLQEDALKSVDEHIDVLDVIPLRFTVDNLVTEKPVGVFATEIKAEFTIIVCHSLNSRNLERVIQDRLGLDICAFVVRPIAIADMCLSIEDTKPGCMLVDLGAETTTVSLYKNGALQYLATIPLGSDAITHDLASSMGVIDSVAEETKRNLANAIVDSATTSSAHLRNISNYVHARAQEIIANIIAQIGYADMATDDIRAGIIITGRGAKLRNFCKLLELQSGLRVRAAAIPASVRINGADINGADFIAPIAVALKGAEYAMEPNAAPCVEQPIVINVPEKVEKEIAAKETQVDAKPKLEAQPKPKAEPEKKQPSETAFALDGNGYDSVDDAGEDDPYLLQDDDKAEELRREQQRREEEQRRREEERRIKEQLIRDKNEQKEHAESEDVIQDLDNYKPARLTLLDRIKNRVERLIGSLDEDDSNTLDD